MGPDDRYPPLRDLAAIGDKRTVALVSLDGTVEWLCAPRFDGDPVFGSLLDRRRGGRFALAPVAPYEARRRYVPESNVLETTFATQEGTGRVTDALTLDGESPTPYTELVRRIDAVAGRCELSWHVEPRFHYGRVGAEPERRDGFASFTHDGLMITVQSHGFGDAEAAGGALRGRAVVEEGEAAALVMGVFADQPAALTGRERAFARLDATVARWRRWSSRMA